MISGSFNKKQFALVATAAVAASFALTGCSDENGNNTCGDTTCDGGSQVCAFNTTCVNKDINCSNRPAGCDGADDICFNDQCLTLTSAGDGSCSADPCKPDEVCYSSKCISQSSLTTCQTDEQCGTGSSCLVFGAGMDQGVCVPVDNNTYMVPCGNVQCNTKVSVCAFQAACAPATTDCSVRCGGAYEICFNNECVNATSYGDGSCRVLNKFCAADEICYKDQCLTIGDPKSCDTDADCTASGQKCLKWVTKESSVTGAGVCM